MYFRFWQRFKFWVQSFRDLGGFIELSLALLVTLLLAYFVVSRSVALFFPGGLFFSPTFSLEEILDGIEQDDPRILSHIRRHHIFEPPPPSTPYNLTNMTSGYDPSEGQSTF